MGPEYQVRRITCRACAQLLEEQRAAADGGSGDNNARIWFVDKRED